MNCSQKLSREHYVSKSLLEPAQGDLTFSGLPWIPKGETRIYSADALASRILCERHNNALSPLDAIGVAAMRTITNAFAHAVKKSLSRKTAYFLISGDGLELWMVKTLAAQFHAGVGSVDGKPLTGEYTYDAATVINALSGGMLPAPLGLNILPVTDTFVEHSYRFVPLYAESLKLVSGLRMATWGVFFDTLVDFRGANLGFFAEARFYRPWIIDLDGQDRTSRIILTWSANRRQATRVGVAISGRPLGPSLLSRK